MSRLIFNAVLGGTTTLESTNSVDTFLITVPAANGTMSVKDASGDATFRNITLTGAVLAGAWNGSTITVPYGGTGAVTLTGYVKGNGTSAMTASATIPNTDITGLGTMSTQNASAVAITGGTISGLGTPLAVASGGSGAVTLTGYVKGNGTSAYTAAATIPNTDITGLGTMSTQNANAVAITGGTISGLGTALPVASGGSGTTTITGLVYGNGTSAMTAASAAQIVSAIGATAVTNATNATNATTTTNIAGGASGSIPYQTASGTTTLLAAGSNTQVLTLVAGVPAWASPATSGTVTSVSGAGTVNGLTLTGTVTSSGSLTLGGTLDLSAPPAIGGATPAAGTFTTLRFNSTLSANGSTGTSGQVLTSNGASAPTWQSVGGVGTVTSVDGSGGTTGLTLTGGPITSSGTLTLGGTLAIANGGTGVTALGTGVVTALGVNTGTAGSFVVNGGALGTPSSGTVTNLTGTASININGTVGATTPTTVVATQVDITAQGDLRLQDTTGGEYVALQAPGTLASSYTLTLPVDDGTAGQALITDGSGVLSWSSAASGDVYGPASATDNAVARYDGTTGKIIQNSAVTIGDDGATVIAANSTTDGLRITQIGTGNALLVEDAANPDASPFVIDANGNVIQDKTTARTNYFAGTTTALFQGSTFAAVDRGGAFDAGPAFILSKNRGATGGNTVVVADDTLGQISFQGADGTNLIPGASIQGQVDGTPGANDMPGRLVFYTTPDGSATLAERMRINNAGFVGIGAIPVSKLDVYAASGYVDARVRSGTNQTYVATDGSASYFGTYSNIPIILSTNNINRGGISAAGTWSLGNAAGAESLRVTPVSSSVNYLNAQGAVTTASPSITAAGSDTNIDITLTPKGTGVIKDANGNIRAVPKSGATKTASYTLAIGDVGEFIEVGTSGAIVIPDATFATGDIVSVFNNTSGNITITCTITTAYIGGTDADKATVTLATRGVATILFISGTVCVINGNVS